MNPLVTDWSAERVLVTGGRGFLGGYVVSALESARAGSVLAPPRSELDLLERGQVRAYLDRERPSVVLHLAAEVGGIGANVDHPGRFAYANLVMGAELFEASRLAGVRRLVCISTTCTYPAQAPLPLKLDDWWSGYPAPETAPYGLAKKMLTVLAKGYATEYGLSCSTVIPANLYGPGDHLEEGRSHVIPALIRRFLEAKASGDPEVVCWGSGTPTREFLFAADAARALLLAAERDAGDEPLQVGSGVEVSIADLAGLIARMTGYKGAVRFDPDQPDGQMRRCLDSSRAQALGFEPQVRLEAGIELTVEWMREILRDA